LLARTFVRSIVVGGAVALCGSLLGSTPAAAQEPFECPDDRICLWDRADGLGESKIIEIMWEGGYNLTASGWANRASSMKNNVQYPVKLIDGTFDTCWTILDTIPPGGWGTIPAADNKVDIVYWSELGEPNPC
jgi:hypothetical protein